MPDWAGVVQSLFESLFAALQSGVHILDGREDCVSIANRQFLCKVFTHSSPLPSESDTSILKFGWRYPKTAIFYRIRLFLDQIHRRRVFGVFVVVEAAAGLAAVQACQNHTLQQCRGREAFLAGFVEHDLGGLISRI